MRAGTDRRQRVDGVWIHVHRRQPDGKPGALVQIAHGLADGNLVIDALVVVRAATLISLKPGGGSSSRIWKCWLLRGGRAIRFARWDARGLPLVPRSGRATAPSRAGPMRRFG
jgi:hypothetical protein